MHKRVVNKAGNRYGRLIVLSHAGTKHGHAIWNCKCDCGNTTIQPSNKLRDKYPHEQSCGCINGLIADRGKNHSAINQIIRSYKKNAKSRGLMWLLSREEALDFFTSPCFFCGVSYSNEQSDYKYNGIDRLDPESHYEIENCVPCCSKCNYMKGTLTVKEFQDQIDKIYFHKKPFNTEIEQRYVSRYLD